MPYQPAIATVRLAKGHGLWLHCVAGFDHFCLVVESDDIESVRQQLAAQGIQAEPQFDGVVVKRFGAQGDAHSIYICDPGGMVVDKWVCGAQHPGKV